MSQEITISTGHWRSKPGLIVDIKAKRCSVITPSNLIKGSVRTLKAEKKKG